MLSSFPLNSGIRCAALTPSLTLYPHSSIHLYHISPSLFSLTFLEFTQVRAVAHALERSMATARVPESLQLSVRQLQDWCARLAPYWSDAAAAATAAADAPPGGTGAAAVQAPLAAVGAGASNGGGGGLLALGPEDMTLSLSHMIPANANAGSGGA